MTATCIAIALTCLVVYIVRDIRRGERERTEPCEVRPVPRCDGCDCPNHCKASAIVRRELAELGVGVAAK